jgi:hypothetical protein
VPCAAEYLRVLVALAELDTEVLFVTRIRRTFAIAKQLAGMSRARFGSVRDDLAAAMLRAEMRDEGLTVIEGAEKRRALGLGQLVLRLVHLFAVERLS